MIDEERYTKADQAFDRLTDDRDQAERKALDALARYKFAMFGYWAGVWVHLNKIIGDKKPNPFAALVQKARDISGVIPGKKKADDSDE